MYNNSFPLAAISNNIHSKNQAYLIFKIILWVKFCQCVILSHLKKKQQHSTVYMYLKNSWHIYDKENNYFKNKEQKQILNTNIQLSH